MSQVLFEFALFSLLLVLINCAAVRSIEWVSSVLFAAVEVQGLEAALL